MCAQSIGSDDVRCACVACVCRAASARTACVQHAIGLRLRRRSARGGHNRALCQRNRCAPCTDDFAWLNSRLYIAHPLARVCTDGEYQQLVDDHFATAAAQLSTLTLARLGLVSYIPQACVAMRRCVRVSMSWPHLCVVALAVFWQYYSSWIYDYIDVNLNLYAIWVFDQVCVCVATAVTVIILADAVVRSSRPIVRPNWARCAARGWCVCAYVAGVALVHNAFVCVRVCLRILTSVRRRIANADLIGGGQRRPRGSGAQRAEVRWHIYRL